MIIVTSKKKRYKHVVGGGREVLNLYLVDLNRKEDWGRYMRSEIYKKKNHRYKGINCIINCISPPQCCFD